MPGRIGSEPGLLRMICEQACDDSDTWRCQLAQLAAWWSRRTLLRWKAWYDERSGTIACEAGAIPAGPETLAWNVTMPDGKRHIARVESAERTRLQLDARTQRPPLVRPGPLDIGEVAYSRERPSIRLRVRRIKTDVKRGLRKYRELHAPS